jgi:hypothetical protein
MTLIDVLSRLKSIRRFNLYNYREGEFGIDTEREYDCNGDYIDSYEIDDIISELEEMKHTEVTMKKQTAVEWVVDKLSLLDLDIHLHPEKYNVDEAIREKNKILQQAKAMFEEQIIDAWQKNPQGFNNTGQQYFNKTYGGDK